jgi:hypothetical protein
MSKSDASDIEAAKKYDQSDESSSDDSSK